MIARAGGVAARVGDARLVVLSCRHAESFVPGLLGAWLAGATVELLPNVQPATLDRVDADEEISWILHDLAELAGRSPKSIYLPDVTPGGPAAPRWPEVAVRMTTSGTTGMPRYVSKSIAQLLDEVEVLAATLPPARAVLSTVPLSHIYGLLFGVLVPLRQGGEIVSHEALLLPADIARVVEERGVERLVSTPAHLRAMAAADMPKGLQVVSSGARLPPELHLALRTRHGWQVTDVLGSTETGGVATRRTPLEPWTPLPGVAVAVAEDGRLQVSSPWCDGGAATLEDRVELRSDGAFLHLGRAGDLVKIAGKRAEAGAIEAIVRAVPGVEDVLLHVPPPAPGREPRVALAVVGACKRADIVAAVTRELDPVFAPRVVRFVARIPRTDRGKVAAESLRELFGIAEGEATTDRFPVRRAPDGWHHTEVPPQLKFFRGHFPGLPILPGVALLERLVWPIIRGEHPDVTGVRGARRLRFRRPLVPGQELAVRVTRSGDRVSFEVRSGSDVVASGQLFVT